MFATAAHKTSPFLTLLCKALLDWSLQDLLAFTTLQPYADGERTLQQAAHQLLWTSKFSGCGEYSAVDGKTAGTSNTLLHCDLQIPLHHVPLVLG